ncbi:hypothetical protein JCM12298_09660 [Desulfothermus naphthae]
MTICKKCKNFFPLEDDSSTGDCVMRVVDPRQAYYKTQPVEANKDASGCPSFQKK